MKNKFNITKEELYKTYITENKVVKEIAQELDVSTATINRFLKKYEIKKDNSMRKVNISKSIQSRTTAEKEAYANKISKSRKNKGLGIEPWNKGKHTGNSWLGKQHTQETKQKISQTKQNKPKEEKAVIEARRLAARTYGPAWNKGMPCPEEVKEKIRSTLLSKSSKEKASFVVARTITKHKNNTFTTSKIEDSFYVELTNFYLKDDIIRQYNEARYPFNCDFYIKPLDMFIELNINWTHGFRPYDPADGACQKQFTFWKSKAETSEYYRNAIYTWTDLDVRKIQKAKENDLLYIMLYSEQDCIEFINFLKSTFN